MLRTALDTAVTTTPENGQLIAAITDPSAAARAVVALDGAGIGVGEVSVRRPSLDDVFFSLTAGPSREVAA